MIKVGSDFSGVGAFNQALQRLGIDYEEVFACDMDKYARQTYIYNFGEPAYYPENVYDREIPKESLDIYMTSPPCQAFSLAGKRLGKEDKRGILFFNSLEFIQENKPRYLIFENVKGLLSHDKKDKDAEYGRTFQEWINHLGGKSVNGNETIFPYEDSVPYHIYFQVLNAKNYGIPQNRERVFIIGIRDDEDNNFQFPKPFPLTKRLKDVLESEVDEKYFLSDKLIEFFNTNTNTNKEKGNGFAFKPKSEIDTSNSITTKSGSRMDDNFVKVSKEVRTNESKATRRETGTNNFRGKKIEFREQQIEEYEGISVHPNSKKMEFDGFKDGNCPKILATDYKAPKCIVFNTQRIRRLTPLECFRLMDFNFGIPNVKDFVWNVSNSQAYKQAGNSICVGVLAAIIEKLNL